MEPLTFLGDAFSEYYFTRVLWEEADLAPLLDAPGASRTHRHAMASLDRAHRALAERQQARSTHTLLVEPLSRLLEWTLGEPERVETEEGSEEAGATLLTTAGAVAARLRWLPPGAPLDRPEEGAHRRFAPVLSMVRVLDEQDLTWGLLTNGYELCLVRRAEGFIHSSLVIDLAAVAEGKEAGALCWRLIWGLLRGEAWSAEPPVLDRVVPRAKDHAEKVGKGLGEQVQRAVVALVQGILDHPANAEMRATLCERDTLHRLYRQALRVLYRILFALYAESRGLLPVDIPAYRESYAVSSLARLATAQETDPRLTPYPGGTFLEDSVRAGFELLRQGADLGPGGRIPKYGGGLFDRDDANPESTHLIESLRWGEAAVAEVLQQLTLVDTKRGQVRVSYRELDVEQLGSIYESLLELSLDVADEDLWLVRVDNRECVVNAAQRAELAGRRGEVASPGADPAPSSVGALLAAPPAPEASETPTAPRDADDEEDGDAEADDADDVDDTDEDADADADDTPASSAPKKPIRVLQHMAPGQAFLRPGIGRKSSGSYYTNRAFVEFLVRQAADPLAEGKTPEEILKLKCVDPAMGSGHFLVGATRRLSEHLLEAYRRRLEEARKAFPDADRDDLFVVADVPDEVARVWDAEDRALTACRLLVAGNCIYGVDKNPLAVDLARVSLWLATAATDHPLSFLDHRLVCGDSLLGYDTDQLLTPPSTKQSKRKADVKKLDLFEQEQMTLDVWDISKRRLRERLSRALGHLHVLGDLAPGDFAKQRLTYRAMLDELRAFWELHELRVGLHFTPGASVTLLERWLGGLGGEGVPEQVRTDCACAIEAGRRQGAFCWPLAFPDVYFEPGDDSGRSAREKPNPGFDVVLGNPPWENPKADSIAFLSQFDPALATMRGREAADREAGILYDPAARTAWETHRADTDSLNAWVNTQGVYPLRKEGRNDLYRLLAERASTVLRAGGRLGMVLSGGVYIDKWTGALRRHWLTAGHWEFCVGLQNRAKQYFPGVDSRQKFALVVWCKQVDPAPTRCLFATGKRSDGNWYMPLAADFDRWLRGATAGALALGLSDLETLSPGTLAIPEFRTAWEAVLMTRLLSGGLLVALGSIEVAGKSVRPHIEYMMNRANQDLFHDRPTLCPIVEGKAVTSFNHVSKSYVSGRGRTSVWAETDLAELEAGVASWRPQYWADPQEALAKVGAERLQQTARIGLADVTAPDNERTFMAALIPVGWVCSDSVNPLLCTPDWPAVGGLLGVINSLAFEYLGRSKVKNHTRWSNIDAVLCPPLAPSPRLNAVARASLRLAHCHASAAGALRMLTGEPDVGPLCEPRARAALRAELEALVADLYGLTEEEFALILSTFPLLDRDQPPLPGDCFVRETKRGEKREPRSFITRDKALLALFDLRGREPPTDIVAFFASAGVDISRNTGPIRDLRQRVAEAERRGAVAYIPSVRGRPPEGSLEDWEVR